MKELVKEFMEAFGQLPNTLSEEDTYGLRVDLIQEEAAELLEAVTDIEELDALVDLAYVVYGAYLHLGIPDADPEHLIYEKEVTVKEIFDAAMNIDAETFDSDLDDVLGLVMTYAQKYDFEGAFKEVHRSNMSKLGLDGRPVKRLDGKVLKGPLYSPPNLAPFV
jgi:predicted HAD superfamily Cof-like phosphohydrolase